MGPFLKRICQNKISNAIMIKWMGLAINETQLQFEKKKGTVRKCTDSLEDESFSNMKTIEGIKTLHLHLHRAIMRPVISQNMSNDHKKVKYSETLEFNKSSQKYPERPEPLQNRSFGS